MNTEKQSKKLTISLADNGLHSLTRGIQFYKAYSENSDSMLLKDAIMSLHHGVELLLKQILVNASPYLIFQDLKDATDKQIRADEKNLAIFFMESPPKTVTYEEALKRIQAFVKAPELEPNLISKLHRLNHLRNQLEHYAIDADIEQITKLMDEIYRPLIDFFEKYIPEMKSNEIPSPEKVSRSRLSEYSLLENEVYSLMLRMKGQTIPGYLLGKEGSFILPSFSKVSQISREQIMKVGEETLYYRPDILAEAPNGIWVVEVKGGRTEPTAAIYQMLYYKSILDDTSSFDATPWIIFFSPVSDTIRALSKRRVIAYF